MIGPLPWVITAGVFLGTLAATAAVCKLAPRIGLLAHPNARSSHLHTTPTGGGIGFALPLLACFALLSENYPPGLPLLLGGAAVALLGLLDDFMNVPRSVRLACHFAVAAGVALSLFAPGWLLGGAMILGLAWWLNLYNFMDGIDGLAASQAAAWAAGALALGDVGASAPLLWALLAASAAFLCFNWAPARVFMGDAGAGFLGLVTGVGALWLWRGGELPIVASAILLLTFWFDATYTLIVRVVTGQAFATAHRTHLYQIIARRLGHGRATSLLWLHVLVWLAPLADASLAFPAWRMFCLLLATAPMAALCVTFRAGMPSPQGVEDARRGGGLGAADG